MRQLMIIFILVFIIPITSYSQSNNDSLVLKDLKRVVSYVRELDSLKLLMQIKNNADYIKIKSTDKGFEHLLANFNSKSLNIDCYSIKDTLIYNFSTAKLIAKSIFYDKYKYDYTPFRFVMLVDDKYWLIKGNAYRDKDFSPEIIIFRFDGRILSLEKSW